MGLWVGGQMGGRPEGRIVPNQKAGVWICSNSLENGKSLRKKIVMIKWDIVPKNYIPPGKNKKNEMLSDTLDLPADTHEYYKVALKGVRLWIYQCQYLSFQGAVYMIGIFNCSAMVY